MTTHLLLPQAPHSTGFLPSQGATMPTDTTYYHYSPLYHLPSILREGLWRGEVAKGCNSTETQAVSLTTQAKPDSLACWGKMGMRQEATAVRYVCRLTEGDLPRLEPQRQTWKRHRASSSYIKKIDGYGQGKWWFHYFGTIPPEQFEVQLRGRAGYVTPCEADLGRIARRIEEERANYEFIRPPEATWKLLIRPLTLDRWLVEDCYPADRLLGNAPAK